jgi:hypothetical protein
MPEGLIHQKRRKKGQNDGENYIMRSFIILTLHLLLLE